MLRIPHSVNTLARHAYDFAGDLADLGITTHRIEPLNGLRRRILIEHNNRTLSVSFRARVPNRRTAVISKLRHVLRELGAA